MPTEPPANAAGSIPASAAYRDHDLIARFRGGDETAFNELFRLYFEPIRDYLLQHTGDVQAAEDAVQVAFIQAYGALGKDDRDIHFMSWMRRVARNALIDVWRWSQRQKRAADAAELEDEDVSWQSLAIEHPSAGTPHSAAERQETLDRFWIVASTLPRDQYHVLLLRLKYGRSSKEAGAILGKEPSAVDVLFGQAKRSLPDAGYAALAKEAPNLVPCLELHALAVTFQPGPLSGDERKQINRHVKGCPVCQEHKQGLSWMDLFAPLPLFRDTFVCMNGTTRPHRASSSTGPPASEKMELGFARKRRHVPLPSWCIRLPRPPGSLPAPSRPNTGRFSHSSDQFSSKGLDRFLF